MGQRTVERAITAGDLRAYKRGRRVLLDPADVRDWITARPVRPSRVGGAA